MPVWVRASSFYESVSHVALEDTLLQSDLILPDDIDNDPISKSGHLLRYWGLGVQYMSSGRDTIQPTVTESVN